MSVAEIEDNGQVVLASETKSYWRWNRDVKGCLHCCTALPGEGATQGSFSGLPALTPRQEINASQTYCLECVQHFLAYDP